MSQNENKTGHIIIYLFNAWSIIIFYSSAINSLLNDVETKYDDIRSVMLEIIPWNQKRPDDSTDEEEEMVQNYVNFMFWGCFIYRNVIFSSILF